MIMTAAYKVVVQSSNDSVKKTKAILLFETLYKTDELINRLNTDLSTYKEGNAENISKVRELLVDGDLGDSLNNCLMKNLIKARNFSGNPQQVHKIDSLKNIIFKTASSDKNWRDELFGTTNSVGASFILLGLQKEVYSIGSIAFSGNDLK
ncbi:hypothetical protein DXN05_22965 [Deminuibacter soli]|uniref:Uncharacterized protein n=2 Tax=Deminuibacter soli TaxID=2291815 RepID=A0A3E1NDA7_9BACT|nr:hypothetical protein DXN05_22965 [Deminuibacter soli]